MFDENKPAGTPVAAAPSSDDLTPGVNYVDELVGEGKKFANLDALAQGKIESDAFIERLQQENAGLRTDLASAKSMEDMVDQLRTPQDAPVDDGTHTPSVEKASPTPEADIAKMVEAQVNQVLTQQERMGNVRALEAKAKELYGEGYQKVLTEKAKSIGIGEEFLLGLAQEQPNAFSKLMFEDKAPAQSAPKANDDQLFPQTQQTGVPSIPKKNWAYYEGMRKKDSVAYWKPAFQNEMHKVAAEMGPSFYDD
jgi:hypothetical protein